MSRIPNAPTPNAPNPKAPEAALRRTVSRDTKVREGIVLTGATGFVGGQLLLRLLRRDRRPILCPVRAESQAAADERGQSTLRALLGRDPHPVERRRVQWLRANLEEPQLGLGREAWWSLAQRTSEIFHCAASVEFDLRLEEAQRINVDGVRHLLTLAQHAGPRFRRFHHVSTAYVAGRSVGAVRAGFLPEDRAWNFRNTYERTKARAERLLQSQDQVPVTIYRPSIIAGDTTTGATTNWNVLYVPMRKIVAGQMPFLRSVGRAIIDSVGVDYVVDGLLALAERPAPHGTTYHLTAGRSAFDIPTYIDAITAGARVRGRAVRTRPVGATSWWLRTRSLALLARAPARLAGLRQLGRAALRGLHSFQPYAPYTSVQMQFESDLEHGWLEARGIAVPDPDAYLERIVGYAIDHDFGRDPTSAPSARDAGTASATRLSA